MSKQNPPKDHHYVPRKFLRPWCNSQGELACRRHSNSPFMTAPEGVAFERMLYSYQSITSKSFMDAVGLYLQAQRQDELQFLLGELKSLAYTAVFDSFLHRHCLDQNANIILAVALENGILSFWDVAFVRGMESAYHSDDDQRAKIEETAKHFMIGGQEYFMCGVEELFGDVLEKLLKENDACQLTADETNRFIAYVVVQLMRTPRILSVFKKLPPSYHDLKTTFLHRLIATRIDGLIQHSAEFELSVIRNQTSLPFISGDIPLLNLVHAQSNQNTFDLFFPISPTRAVFYAQKGRLNQIYPKLKSPDANIIHEMNQCLCQNCMHMVFATDINIYNQFGYAVPLQDENKIKD